MRYLFCAFTKPSRLYPLAGLAVALRRRGHDVAFVTGGLAEPMLASLGLPRVPRGQRDGDSFCARRWDKRAAVAIDVKHVEYALEQFTPHVIIADLLSLGAHIAQERTSLPLCVLGMAAYLWPQRAERRPRVRRITGESCPTLLASLEEARRFFGLRERPQPPGTNRASLDAFLVGSFTDIEHKVAPPSQLPGSQEFDLDSWHRLCTSMAAKQDWVLHPNRTVSEPNWRRTSPSWRYLTFGATHEARGAWISVLAYTHRSSAEPRLPTRSAPSFSELVNAE